MGLDELEYGLSQLRKHRKRFRMAINVVGGIIVLALLMLVLYLAADISL